MSKALNYEYLLRRIYQVGRYGKKDVDAYVYRKLERAENIYLFELDNIENQKPRLRKDTIEGIAYDYKTSNLYKYYNKLIQTF